MQDVPVNFIVKHSDLQSHYNADRRLTVYMSKSDGAVPPRSDAPYELLLRLYRENFSVRVTIQTS